MKKRILSVLLCLCLGLTSFLTTAFTAFAADGANWSDEANRDTIWTDGAISTPEQLAQFAYLVNTGAYTGKNDVWLTQDVDLAGHEWTAIGEYKGSLQDYTGDTSKFFRGVFDGNGYTVKNMQLTKFPGGTLDLCIVGLFGGTNATIRNLTVTGSAATQDSSARIYMGAIAGMYPEGTISNCTSRLSMDITTTSASYIGGIVGSSSGTITRCTNEADITLHSPKSNVGGIVAGSQRGKIDRCVNKGRLAGETAFTGGISAYVFGAPSTVTNCANYGEITSTAAVPSSIGGIIGLYNGTGMSNCYNTGLIQPQRSGGLIGQVDETALNTLDNLYYSAEGSALGVYKRGNTVVTEEKNDVGVKKTEADMKQENFVADLNGNGDAFIGQKDGFPTIAPLAVNVVIDATPKDAVVSLSQSEGGAAIDPQPDGSYILLPGDYFIQASAADHYPVSFTHMVSYDRSTLLVTITLEPLPADYSKVDEAIARANALNKDEYKDFTAVEEAVEAVERGKNITEQSEVDAMAKAIEDAIGALQYKDADYTKVDEAIARANALNKDEYKDFTAVEAAVEAVERGKNITGQSEVDAMAKAIEDAIGALQYKDADYTKVDEAIARANALNKDEYKDFTAVEAAVEAVERGKNITGQSEVDAMARAIEDAIGALQYKDADYTKVDEAIEKANVLNKDEYKDFTAVEAAVEAVERGKNITEQSEVDAMAKAIEDAINSLQRKTAEPPKEKPTENPTNKPTEKPSDFTQTGDSANLSAWIFLLLISGIGILGAAFYPRKRKTQ